MGETGGWETRIRGEIWEKVGCDIWEKRVGGRKLKNE